jgi:hypothetical protein
VVAVGAQSVTAALAVAVGAQLAVQAVGHPGHLPRAVGPLLADAQGGGYRGAAGRDNTLCKGREMSLVLRLVSKVSLTWIIDEMSRAGLRKLAAFQSANGRRRAPNAFLSVPI